MSPGWACRLASEGSPRLHPGALRLREADISALTNTVFAAIGKRVRKLLIDPTELKSI